MARFCPVCETPWEQATPTPPTHGDDPMMTVIIIAIGGVAVVILMGVLQKKGIIKR